MALDQAGVQFIALGGDQYITTLSGATKATDSFVDATEKGGGRVSGAGQIMIGALRQVGTIAIDAFAKAAKATVDFVGDSIGLAGDFEQGMLNFQAVAGKDVDASGLEDFRDLFIDIGKRLPVSTMEVQQAAAEMVKGGIDPAALAAGALEQNIQFAAAAMEGDLVKAAEISSKILGGWAGVGATAAEKADFLTHATDLLTKAANASATDVEGLAKGIFNAQGIARTAGVSFDDLTTALAELAPRFASSSEAGNSLKNMIARLQPTTDPATQAMMSLGLYTEETGSAFYDAQGNFVGFEKASQLLKESLTGLTKEQQAATLQQIFGNDAMGSAAALAELGAAGYQEMALALTNANGVADAAALKQQGFNTSLDNTKGSVEAMQITIGSFLLPVLGDLLDNYVAPAINAITDFTESFFKMVPAIMASDDPLQSFLNALKIAAPGLFDFIVAIEDIKDAITPAINEIMRLADAFSKDGLGGLIDAVAGDIQAALPDIEDALLDWGQAFVDWIAPMIPPALDALGKLAGEAWDWVKDQAPGWGRQLLDWGDELVDWIAPMIPPALAELSKLGDQFLGWIGDQAAPLLKRFNDWATSFVAWIPGATVTFLAEWPKMFDQFLDWIGNEAGPLLKKLGDWALSFIQWIAPMIPPFLVALGGVALAIGTFVVETAAVLAGKIINTWVPAMIGWIVTDAIPGLYKALESVWQVFQGWVLDVERDLAQKMRDVGKAIIDGIVSGVNAAAGSLMSTLKNLASNALQAAKDALGISSPSKEFAAVGEFAVTGLMQGFTDTWPALTQLVGSLSKDLIDDMTSIGQDMQSAIADGFGATASIDRQIAKNLDSFKDVLPKYEQYTTGALKEAQSQAEGFLDPAEGAKFFQMRSKQILEYAKLQKDLSEATSQEDKQRIEAQMELINRAQTAEISQFNANVDAQQNATDQIAQSINAVMAALAGINLTDDQIKIVDMLSGVWAGLQTPAQSRADAYAHPPQMQYPSGGQTTNTNTQNINMPIYTNQSPAVVQQSWAIMQASMP